MKYGCTADATTAIFATFSGTGSGGSDHGDGSVPTPSSSGIANLNGGTAGLSGGGSGHDDAAA